MAESLTRALAAESLLPHERTKGFEVEAAEDWVSSTDIQHEDSTGLGVHVLLDMPHCLARFGSPRPQGGRRH
jgi:hypothetical protein